MTDFASGPEVGVPAPATNPLTIRVGVLLALVVAAVGVFGYFTTTSMGRSGAAGLIKSDVEATFSPKSVSCREVAGIPALTARAIFACHVKGVEAANRPASDHAFDSFTRCYVRTSGDQTVDVSRAVSVISQDHGKTAPCS